MSSGMWQKNNNIIKNNNNFEKPVYTHTTICLYTHPQVCLIRTYTHTRSLSIPLSLLPQETIRFAAPRRGLCISSVFACTIKTIKTPQTRNSECEVVSTIRVYNCLRSPTSRYLYYKCYYIILCHHERATTAYRNLNWEI